MNDGRSLAKLIDLMRTLLGPKGCPWDRDQTLQTLRQYVIEEAYEVVDAIDRGEPEMLREELGDLLLQVVFQAELASKQGWFQIDEVVGSICEKLIRRHPWVFGDEELPDAGGALRQWEEIKAVEKKGSGALSGVPTALPALLRAVRVGSKASAVGYDWPDLSGARGKVDEELSELDEAAAAQDSTAVEHELGDLLFALSTYARKQGIDPEAALRGTIERFSSRFRHCELEADQEGKTLRDYDAAELDVLWEQAKSAERLASARDLGSESKDKQ